MDRVVAFYQKNIAKKASNDSVDVIKNMKEKYDLDAAPISSGRLKSTEHLCRELATEARKFLLAVKKTDAYKDFLQEVTERPETHSYTVPNLNGLVKIQEGPTGWDSSMEVINGALVVREALAPIVEEMAVYLNFKFVNYLESPVEANTNGMGQIFYEIISLD